MPARDGYAHEHRGDLVGKSKGKAQTSKIHQDLHSISQLMRRFLAVGMFDFKINEQKRKLKLPGGCEERHECLFLAGCVPRVDNLAGWRTGAKIKFPV